MAVFTIEGGVQLKGTLEPQGAKNEALQVICATLLTDQEVILCNVPEIRDVMKLLDLLRGMGTEIARIEKGKYSFRTVYLI